MTQDTVYASLRNKAVFITGGATGIGAAMVNAFAGQGANVVFIDINDSAGKTLQQSANAKFSGTTEFIPLDVTKLDALQAAIDRVVERFDSIDILVNNVANDIRHKADKVTQDQWHACMLVNLDTAFFAAQAAFRHMKRQRNGSIINFSSINAGTGPKNMVGYNTAKAGILGMTKSLANDFGQFGVRVNAIKPGWVATDKQLATWLTEKEEKRWLDSISLKTRITEADVAKLALFLGSDDSRVITGQAIAIDAGRT